MNGDRPLWGDVSPGAERMSANDADPWYLPSSRQEAILGAIRRDGAGLEIGPCHRPLAPKRAGFDVHVLDHASAEELRAKYAGHGVDLSAIEDVDFIWRGRPLPEVVGREACYDWIIASHVIEHVPDFAGFLMQCERLLTPSGVLALVVPDKRYCFDAYQSLTSTGEILDAHERRESRPSAGRIFDHVANAAWLNPGGAIAWDRQTRSDLALVHSIDEAKAAWTNARTSTDYADVHCWRFTPSRFLLVLADLRACGLTRLGLAAPVTWSGCEFYAVLRRDADAQPVDRRELLERCRHEMR